MCIVFGCPVTNTVFFAFRWPCSEAEWASNKIGSQRNVNPNFIITAEGEKKYF